MGIINTDIIHEFDLIENHFTDAIRRSSKKLIEKYLTFSRNKVNSSETLIKFWPGLINMPKEEIKKGVFKVYILPLNRVEAEEGASGSKVFVAYFSFVDDKSDFSNPLLLKLRDLKTDKKYKKLKYEKEQADNLIHYVKDKAGFFIFPNFYDENNGIGVLWAFFSSSVFSYTTVGQKKPSLKEDNLWKSFNALKLTESNEPTYEKIRWAIKSTYIGLSLFHMKDDFKKVNNKLQVEYEWYLREQKFLKEWEYIWGRPDISTTNDFGREWVNPLYVFKKLENYSADLTYGAVHGDIHTKNILFTADNRIKIIDFGWGKTDSHIAKDFILMESNLRFMILHPDLPFSDIEKISQTLMLTEEPSLGYQCGYSTFIQELIFTIRKAAFEVLDKDRIYDEYLIPLFYLCLGLLEFSKTFNNIISARLTILNLAHLINEHLNKRDENHKEKIAT